MDHSLGPALLVALLALDAATCSAQTQEAHAPRPPSAAETAAPAPLQGQDFSTEARLLYQIVACADGDPLPDGIDPAVVKTHCEWMKPKMEAYRKLYVGVAEPYLATLRPEGVSRMVCSITEGSVRDASSYQTTRSK